VMLRTLTCLFCFFLVSLAKDACDQFLDCKACTQNTDCVWCDNTTKGNGTIDHGCFSGSMFGPVKNSSCTALAWKYKQCVLPGLWVLIIAAICILLVVLLVALLVYYFCKTKPKDDQGTLLIQKPDRERHTQPLDILQQGNPYDGESSNSLDPLKGALGVVPPPQSGRQIGDWTEYKDEKGDSYYHNTVTDESTWDPPPEFRYAEEYEYTPEQEEYFRNNTGRYLVRTLYPFTSDRPDLWQLSFEEGELIWVIDSHHEEDWWIGEKCDTGQRGYFPRTYVQVLKRKFKVGGTQGEKVQELTRELSKHGL